MITIDVLHDADVEEYNGFLKQSASSLFYASAQYRSLLRAVLCDEDQYLIARDTAGRMIGVLPAFIRDGGTVGPVLNSLPFYGSHGAVIDHSGNRAVKLALVSAFQELARARGCASYTLITSPFENDPRFYDEHMVGSYRTERIGQLTQLPMTEDCIADQLLAMYHQKTRNSVRKSMRAGFTLDSEYSIANLQFLSATHEINMRELGGVAKPARFFEAIIDSCKYDRDWRLYVASLSGQPVAALLLLYFNATVEYFTPAIVAEFRSLQPLSFLVFHAMQDAVRAGYHWWNWGGTWQSQKAVHLFKRRWGTVDLPYFYYTCVGNREVLECRQETLLSEYSNYYVVPFDQLAEKRESGAV